MIFHNGANRFFPKTTACSSLIGMYVLGSYTALIHLLAKMKATNSPPAIAPLTAKDVRNEAVDAESADSGVLLVVESAASPQRSRRKRAHDMVVETLLDQTDRYPLTTGAKRPCDVIEMR